MQMYAIKEKEVTIPSVFPLSGTLTIPEQSAGARRPAVLILSGSGDADRDGYHPKLPMKLYKELAAYIGTLGFAVLRYDKRGVGQSGGKYLETGFRDLADDASDCVEWLRTAEHVDPKQIILLGHSEGCVIAPAVYAENRVQGLILLAGPAETLQATLHRQTELTLSELQRLTGFKGFLVRLFQIVKKTRRKNERLMEQIVGSSEPVVKIRGIQVNAKWLREHFAYNVLKDLAEVDCPTLAVSGGQDIQVLPEHAKKLAETVRGEAEWHIIPNMSHQLKETTEPLSMLSLLDSYKHQIDLPVHPELKQLLSTWLQKHFS